MSQKIKINVACIQMKAASLSEFPMTAQRICDLLRKAGDEGCDLAVLPECVYPAYCAGVDRELFESAMAEQEGLLERVAGICREYKIMAALGIPMIENGRL